MNPAIFFKDYLLWHYGKGLGDFASLARGLLWFCCHFFSIPVLTRTLFSPFSRIHENYFSINNIQESLQNIVANTVSRAVGFFLRSVVIATGVICEILLTVLVIIAWIGWLILPLITSILLMFGMGIFG